MGDTIKNVKRRTFIAGSAALGAAMLSAISGVARPVEALADDYTAPEPENSSGKTLVRKPQYSFEYIPEPIDESLITETVDCEVCVVGAGVASMGAIMYLADRGVDVQVVEKGPHEGVHRVCIAGINAATGLAMGSPIIDPKAFT